jgi:hypothetical protein
MKAQHLARAHSGKRANGEEQSHSFGSVAQNQRKFGWTKNADVATAIIGLGNIIRFGRLSFAEMTVLTCEMK